MPTALITGAAVHLGKAIANRFAQAGYDVIVHANRSRDQLDALCEALRAKGIKATPIAADLTTQEGQEALCAGVKKACQQLDVVAHNAALFESVPFEAVSREHIRHMMALNFEAPFFITQALLPLLKKAPEACVINIVDIATRRPYRHYAAYTSSKGALETLTRCLAMELAPTVRVNGISPYVVMYEGHIEETLAAQFIERTPLKRNASPEEIADAALFIATQAPYMTGHILTLDGGRSIKP